MDKYRLISFAELKQKTTYNGFTDEDHERLGLLLKSVDSGLAALGVCVEDLEPSLCDECSTVYLKFSRLFLEIRRAANRDISEEDFDRWYGSGIYPKEYKRAFGSKDENP